MSDPGIFVKYGKFELRIALKIVLILLILLGRVWGAW